MFGLTDVHEQAREWIARNGLPRVDLVERAIRTEPNSKSNDFRRALVEEASK